MARSIRRPMFVQSSGRNRHEPKESAMSATSIERLECRICMDGNVQAAIVGGDLEIRGDAQDNSVVLQRINGKIRVTGLEGTRIGGQNFREFATTFDDLELHLRQGGNDDVLLHGGMKIN